MSNLYDVTIDEIETAIMSVLFANMGERYTQFTLFEELLKNKFDSHGNSIHPNFKSKFLLVLDNLRSKYDDIEITKKDKIYFIKCKSDDDKETQLSEQSEPIVQTYKNELSSKLEGDHILLKKSDEADMYDYICENNLKYVDPFDGNTIFHKLIEFNNIRQTTKLINKNEFNFEIKNYLNESPVDLINSYEMSNLIVMGLIKKLSLLVKDHEQEKLNIKMILNDNISYYSSEKYLNETIMDTSVFEFISIKTQKYHFIAKFYLVSFLVCYIALRIML
jgi:hypothetical protein